ncbi:MULTISPECIES: DUF418 domain-containing protein [Tsukamurella]|uniref:DUF418 domain-containing protein n=3 Tax=Tsukamurella TaxID=2060 RepID=A0A5C5S0I7_9ACTN|nr:MULTISPECIES: DUF418 domain-containing protein [Tsukamurella]NMD54705.1 DUF418 domain-containing protein [Tsukamurella columbiensis]TWS28614.1 DUF418 domain-containing protein [Tsukamurella conjunctivitidis]
MTTSTTASTRGAAETAAAGRTPARRGPAPRMIGLDLARALAVIGMFYAHVGRKQEFVLLAPSTWDGIVVGRSSALFVLLSGLGLGLMTRGRAGDALATRRREIVYRGVFLFFVGGVLVTLGVHISIILATYAVLFWLALPLFSLSDRALLRTAAAAALLGPLVNAVVVALITRFGDPGTEFAKLLATGNYPVLIWIAYLVAGIAVGRLALDRRATATRLIGLGAAMLLAYPTAWVLSSATGTVFDGFGGVISAGGMPAAGDAERDAWHWVWSDAYRFVGAQPHSGTQFEVIGNIGFALALIGACLLLGARAPRLLAPVARVGRMSLSLYCLHIVAVFVLLHTVQDSRQQAWLETDWRGTAMWLAFTVGAFGFATAWFRHRPTGPLEEVMRRLPGRLEARS